MGKLGEKFVITKFFALAHFLIFLKSSRLSFFEKITVALLIFSLVKAGYLCAYTQKTCEGGFAPFNPQKDQLKKGQSYIKLMID